MLIVLLQQLEDYVVINHQKSFFPPPFLIKLSK